MSEVGLNKSKCLRDEIGCLCSGCVLHKNYCEGGDEGFNGSERGKFYELS